MDEKFGRIHNWGKSMYGGYYVNMWAADGSYRWVGFHFDRLSALREWAKENGVEVTEANRWDNI